jgi:hypothetical protein
MTGPTNGAFFATFMLDSLASPTPATYSVNQGDENLEWNVWSHAMHHVTPIAPAEPHVRLDIGNIVPTNR